MARKLRTIANLQRLVRQVAADQRGVTAIVTALSLVVLMGFGGLAIDVASWLAATRSIQAAADQGAYSAAGAAGQNTCPNASATTHATAVVAAHGYIDGQNNTTVAVECASSSSFRVRISQQQPMWFTRLFLDAPPTASRHATAQIAGQQSNLCILALDGYNPAESYIGSDANSFFVTGSSNVNVGCGVAVDSSSNISLGAGSNAASLSATDIYLVGDMQPQSNGFTPNITATGCPNCNPPIPPNQILKHQRPIADPYANRAVPDHNCPAGSSGVTWTQGTLSPSNGNGPGTTANIGYFCGGLNLSPPNNVQTVTVGCGTYVIAGGQLQLPGGKAVVQANCTGGVTFILTNSRPGASDYAQINYQQTGNSGQLKLTAPSTGPYGGLVFFQDRNAPSPNQNNITNSNTNSCGGGSAQNKISGNGNGLVLVGAVYFPSQTLCFAGGSATDSTNKCTQIIAYNINFTGGSAIKSQCEGVGVAAISVPVPQLIQ